MAGLNTILIVLGRIEIKLSKSSFSLLVNINRTR